ncbi:plastid aspartate carbamoyltransferase [Dunaliella salina]|uniref:aspartate carbamoyltransferase n=1 Tax=Dunaliella salina TaxID=3046 RepID=A0ABQ7GVA1_DUNSA|nr:plastid aspartate carbamoyltransferase [Dunaliella salina]|eukprot:KAF5838551.1 plastid aspartate carbamoyltransferase [Dunaliella salina]
MALNVLRAASGSTATCSSHETFAPLCRQQQTRQTRRRNVAAKTAPAERVSPVEPLAAVPWHQLDRKHVLHANQFNKESLDMMFEEAIKMEKVRPRTPESKMLEGYIMSTLFYEPSTRTRLSFESAMSKLGGTVISTESAGEYSSAAKGETLEDTIRTVEGYADCIVLRHFQEGYAKRAASVAQIPIINAGDGPGQHPTQALLDVYTIKREVGRLENIKIGMVGDLLNGRTVRSLAYVLSLYPGLQVYFVAPPVVRMRDDIKELLTSRGVPWREVDDLREVAADVDVLYMTRIQKERFKDMQEYEQARGKYVINKELMKSMQKHAVVLHPLPRVDEIAEEVDGDPRSAYFRQARNGLFIRMAILKLAILGTQ